MTLVLLHSPKGGVGTTMIAAQLAIHLAQHGREVVALDLTHQGSLKMHFGLRLTHTIPDMADHHAEPMVVAGVALRDGYAFSQLPEFAATLADDPAVSSPTTIVIADIAAADHRLKDLLLPYATFHLCALTPGPGSLAVLPLVDPETATVMLDKTLFVLNHLDDRIRLSRNTRKFLNELFGDRIVGTVRRDEAVNEALATFEPLARYAPSSAALTDLAALGNRIEALCEAAVADHHTAFEQTVDAR